MRESDPETLGHRESFREGGEHRERCAWAWQQCLAVPSNLGGTPHAATLDSARRESTPDRVPESKALGSTTADVSRLTGCKFHPDAHNVVSARALLLMQVGPRVGRRLVVPRTDPHC